ncbi:MAG: Ig-like domain-containing protein [Chitinophagales bacterium]
MKKLLLLFSSVFCLQILFAQNVPVAVNDTFTINQNQASNLPVLSNDYDLDGDPLTLTVLNGPYHGSVVLNGGIFAYTPQTNFSGTDSLHYVVCDPANTCDTALVIINVLAGNNFPTAINDTFSVNKNQTTNLPVLSNDYDVDGDPLTISLVDGPFNGSAIVNSTVISYTPNTNYVGADSLHYSICDNGPLCDTATVYITVVNFNSAPVAVNDSFTINPNQPATLPVLSNDADPEGDALNVAVGNNPAHGTVTVNGNGEVVYTPATNYVGPDSFTYTICDIFNQCDTAAVYVVVAGNLAPPVAVNDAFTMQYDGNNNGLTLGIVGNDYAPDSSAFVIVAVWDADSAQQTFSLNFDSISQEVRVEPAFPNACGVDSFYYAICNANNLCDTAVIHIDIKCPDGLPEIGGFSPDGDGKNDALVFTGIENFAPVAIKVFNRYGRIVYQADDYQNDWKGIYKEENVPDGTYFYTLEYNGKKQSHYVVIQR